MFNKIRIAAAALILIGCGDGDDVASVNSTTIVHDTVVVKIPTQDSADRDSEKSDTIITKPEPFRFDSVGDTTAIGSWLQYKYSASAGLNIPSRLLEIQANGRYTKTSFSPCPGESDLNSSCGKYEYGTMNFDNKTSKYKRFIDSSGKKDVKGGSITTTSRNQISVTNSYRHVRVAWRQDGGLILDSVGSDTVTYTYWLVKN